MSYSFFGDRMFSGITTKVFTVSLLCSLFSIYPAAWGSQSVSLAWDMSSDPSVAGYVVYAGSSSTNYSTRVDVGTNATATVTGLTEGRTNYFYTTAYNAAKIESLASANISYIVPGRMFITTNAVAGIAPRLSFPVAVGHYYEVQASTNLQSWATIFQTSTATTNIMYGYQDPQGASLKKRFYRLVMH